jgi:hypothetical protein
MKKKLLFLLFVFTSGCSGSELSQIHWAPPFDEGRFGDLKTMLVLEGDLGKIEQCCLLAKIEDSNQIENISLENENCVCNSYSNYVPELDQKALCIVDENNKAFMFPIDWSVEEKRVTFAGGYSENLYNFLDEYGVIESANSPDVTLFSSDPQLLEIEFIPMPQYAGCNGNLEKVVFLEGDHYDFVFNRAENWEVLAETTDPNEFNKIKLAFSSGEFCIFNLLDYILIETAIGFIYEDNRGELFIIAPDREKQVVEFEGGYSKELYDILISYGIIKPD